jgi:hypothetical protein
MKQLIAILLLLVTAFYVLPVSDGFLADTETQGKYADKNSDDCEDGKKDKSKEFITAAFITTSAKANSTVSLISPIFSVLPVHFTVETPPPDRA